MLLSKKSMRKKRVAEQRIRKAVKGLERGTSSKS
jgi:hypothetical protein